MNYFDSGRKNLTYFFEAELGSDNACHNSCFSYIDN